MTDTTISRMWIMRWRPTSRSALPEGKIERDELGNTHRRIMGGEGRGRDEDCSSPPAQIPACAANAPGLYEG